jgi:hypothetical protein
MTDAPAPRTRLGAEQFALNAGLCRRCKARPLEYFGALYCSRACALRYADGDLGPTKSFLESFQHDAQS